MTSPTQQHNALAARYSDRTLLEWVAQPTESRDLQQMRTLMQATMLLGVENPSQAPLGQIHRVWTLSHSTRTDDEYKMRLTFAGLASSEHVESMGNFLFQIERDKKIIMTGFDARQGDKPSHEVSFKYGYADIRLLHEETVEEAPYIRKRHEVALAKARL